MAETSQTLWKTIKQYFNALPDKEHLHRFTRAQRQLHRCHHRCDAHFPTHGTDHRHGIGDWYRRFALAQKFYQELLCSHGNQCAHSDDLLFDFSAHRGTV